MFDLLYIWINFYQYFIAVEPIIIITFIMREYTKLIPNNQISRLLYF